MTSSSVDIVRAQERTGASGASHEASPPLLGQFSGLLASLRPHQWTKNLLVLAALVFAEKLYDLSALGAALVAFALFCLLSGAVYLVNDLVDLEADRLHPVKSLRPLAAGKLSPGFARVAAPVIAILALAGSFLLNVPFGVATLVYFLLMMGYSLALKNVVIVDVLVIAFGFVLRAIAGAMAIDVDFSNWLLICTLLAALFLALCKRRQELTLLAGDATGHRRILGEYSPYLLDQMIALVTASTLVSYALYTQAPETVAKFGTDKLVYSLPFVLYGILRYLYLVHLKEQGGSPARVLLNDRPILVTVALWAATVVTVVYHYH